MRPREPRGFQRLHPLWSVLNVYNNLGNLLFAQKQAQGSQGDGFWHSSGTVPWGADSEGA